ncbi:MAG: class II aldolase/adducin family protein [Burkholderiaceae bacterium]|jgi:L-fuculose-phosphate aldolase|nr:class II aldolase/adducin family protein [Burkholderiaceae bacterium]
MSENNDLAIRTSIVKALQSMSQLGINKGTSGNVSVRGENGFYVSPTGLPYAGMQPEHIVFMNWDGTFSGDVLPSSEWRFHRDILAERTELNAVVHTHSTHATAVSILGHDIPAIHYVVAAAGGNSIPCAKYETFGTEELGHAILKAMKGRRACLLAHHGTIAAGVNLARAMALSVTVEEMASLYLACLPHGKPPTLSDEEMLRVLEKFKTYGQQPTTSQEKIRQAL